MTLSNLAKLAHVSVSTASKAFSMSAEINEETRQEIFRVAKEQGCFKKFYNGKYPRYVVAVLCPEFSSLNYARPLAWLQEYLGRHNCEICVASTDFKAETAYKLMDYYDKYSKVDAILMLETRAIENRCELPLVTVEIIDLAQAMQEVVDHFRARGATVGFIGEPHTTAKQELFERAMGADLERRFISSSTERFEAGGYLAMEALFERNAVPRALICAYDYMAIGAMRCIFDHGLRIPEDVAIVGMDNLPEARYLNPPLTSIDSNYRARCENAADQLLSLLNGTSPPRPDANVVVVHWRRSSEI